MVESKPGYKTTEFWKTVATDVFGLITLIFHKDFSAYVPAVGIAGSAIANAVYAFSRSKHKSAYVQALMGKEATAAVAAINAKVTTQQ